MGRSYGPEAPATTADASYPYGFMWGPIKVTRLFEERGRRVLHVATDHCEVEIYVSPQGRSVRVWIDGKEVQS